jgi:hypothetical protein
MYILTVSMHSLKAFTLKSRQYDKYIHILPLKTHALQHMGIFFALLQVTTIAMPTSQAVAA